MEDSPSAGHAFEAQSAHSASRILKGGENPSMKVFVLDGWETPSVRSETIMEERENEKNNRLWCRFLLRRPARSAFLELQQWGQRPGASHHKVQGGAQAVPRRYGPNG
jgi:hypothetical protein